MDLRAIVPEKSAIHVIVRRALRRYSPWAVHIGLLSLFVMYSLASLFGPASDWLFGHSKVVVAAAFGLGWLAFTTLLSAETETVKPQGSQVIPLDALGAELRKLASERKLELDIFAYSTETFVGPLDALFKALRANVGFQPSIKLRVLLRDWDHVSFLPGCPTNITIDSYKVSRYRGETKSAHARTSKELWSRLSKMQASLPGMTFDFRVYPFDPFHKGIVINRRRAFWSLYSISGTMLTDYPEILDYQGKGVNFAEFRNDGTPSEAEALSSICEWFDTVWELCSKDFRASAFPSDTAHGG